jgi:hypothetical protein
MSRGGSCAATHQAGQDQSEAIQDLGRVGFPHGGVRSRSSRFWARSPFVPSRDGAIESVKKVIHSYVDRAAAGGPRIPRESYEEVLEVEIEVPLKGVLT